MEYNADEIIRGTCSDVIEKLTHLIRSKTFTPSKFEINSNELREEKWLEIDIRKSGRYVPLISELRKVKGPVLYWIEIKSPEISCEDIYQAISTYKDLKSRDRVIPAFNALNLDKKQSQILYVGKVIRDFYGRVIQHFGYFKTPATQGLQIAHWTHNLDLKLEFNYIPLSNDMADLMEVIEYGMAKKLHPIIGTHK